MINIRAEPTPRSCRVLDVLWPLLHDGLLSTPNTPAADYQALDMILFRLC